MSGGNGGPEARAGFWYARRDASVALDLGATHYRPAPLLIVGMKTRAGLIVKARLDRKIYKRRIKVLAQEMKVLALEPHLFHGE